MIPGKDPAYCHRAVVLGAGPVGLLGAMVLVANGFDTIVYSRGPVSSPQASFVQAIGVTYSCSETDSAERLAQRVGNIDLVYEAARDLLVDEPNGIKQVVTFDQGKE